MKKIFPLIACVCMLIASLAIPSMAAESAIPWAYDDAFSAPDYIDSNGNVMEDGDYSGTLYVASSPEGLQPGTYYVLGNSPVGVFPSDCTSVLLVLLSDGGVTYRSYGFGESFEVPEGYVAGVIAQSQYTRPVLYSGDNNSGSVTPYGDGLYYDAFDLFRTFIFGGNELNEYEGVICSGLATASVILLSIAPFVLVYWIIRVIGRW